MSIFLLPIQRDLEISRAAASLPITVARLLGGLQGPAFGFLIDKHGPARVLFAAAFLCGLGFILLGFVDSYFLYFLVFVFVISMGFQSGIDSPTMTAIGRWFVKKRTSALTWSGVGYPFGGAVIVPLLALGVGTFDWRITSIALGGIIWALVLPLALRVKDSPESMGLEPDGVLQSSSDGAPRAPAYSQYDFSVREAMSTRAYWQLAINLGLRSMVWGAIGVHLVGIWADKGLSESTAGVLVGLTALMGMPMTLVFGWLAVRWTKRKALVLADVMLASGFLFLLLIGQAHIWQMVIVSIFWSPNQGVWSLSWALLADVFGRKNFGTLRGGIIAIWSFMSFSTPFLAGLVFDETGSYTIVIAAALLLGLINLALDWTQPSEVLHQTQRQPVTL